MPEARQHRWRVKAVMLRAAAATPKTEVLLKRVPVGEVTAVSALDAAVPSVWRR
jgi:hypothetical protein